MVAPLLVPVLVLLPWAADRLPSARRLDADVAAATVAEAGTKAGKVGCMVSASNGVSAGSAGRAEADEGDERWPRASRR